MALLDHSDPDSIVFEDLIVLGGGDAKEAAASGVAAPSPPMTPRRRARSWLFVVAAVVTVVVLVARVLDGAPRGELPSPPHSAPGDAGDRTDEPEGARLPPVDRQFTSGDPKDHTRYRSPLTTWQYTTGDAKDHAGWHPTLPGLGTGTGAGTAEP